MTKIFLRIKYAYLLMPQFSFHNGLSLYFILQRFFKCSSVFLLLSFQQLYSIKYNECFWIEKYLDNILMSNFMSLSVFFIVLYQPHTCTKLFNVMSKLNLAEFVMSRSYMKFAICFNYLGNFLNQNLIRWLFRSMEKKKISVTFHDSTSSNKL